MTTQVQEPLSGRLCLRKPIPQIADAARHLDGAVSAHLLGQSDRAEELIRLADMPEIREWTDSLWGKKGKKNLYVQNRFVADAPPKRSIEQREKVRMPTLDQKQELLRRDRYHCRFCEIPVIRREIRERIRKRYPRALQWGHQNVEQHAAFQAMWAQYDHVMPHARGGSNDLKNVVITCAPCNFGRMNYTLEEVGLIDPWLREPIRSTWDGLERFH